MQRWQRSGFCKVFIVEGLCSKMQHDFIFKPGNWEGEGNITFSMADDVLPFKVYWTVFQNEDEKITFNQVIDVEGFSESLRNYFTLFKLTFSTFEIDLQSSSFGKVEGKGLMTDLAIGWEFNREDQDFQGYEIYELQSDGSYKMRAEFTSGDNYRTHVQAHLKSSKSF